MPGIDLLSAPTPTPSPTWVPVAPPQITRVEPEQRLERCRAEAEREPNITP